MNYLYSTGYSITPNCVYVIQNSNNIATSITGRLVVKTAYPDQIDSPHENCRAQELSEGKE